jgi:hypothetical protein
LLGRFNQTPTITTMTATRPKRIIKLVAFGLAGGGIVTGVDVGRGVCVGAGFFFWGGGVTVGVGVTAAVWSSDSLIRDWLDFGEFVGATVEVAVGIATVSAVGVWLCLTTFSKPRSKAPAEKVANMTKFRNVLNSSGFFIIVLRFYLMTKGERSSFRFENIGDHSRTATTYILSHADVCTWNLVLASFPTQLFYDFNNLVNTGSPYRMPTCF